MQRARRAGDLDTGIRERCILTVEQGLGCTLTAQVPGVLLPSRGYSMVPGLTVQETAGTLRVLGGPAVRTRNTCYHTCLREVWEMWDGAWNLQLSR